MLLSGGVSRVAKGADCKSAVLWLRRFESFFPHQLLYSSLILLGLFAQFPHLPHRCGNRSSAFGLLRKLSHMLGREPFSIGCLGVQRGHLSTFPAENCF